MIESYEELFNWVVVDFLLEVGRYWSIYSEIENESSQMYRYHLELNSYAKKPVIRD